MKKILAIILTVAILTTGIICVNATGNELKTRYLTADDEFIKQLPDNIAEILKNRILSGEKIMHEKAVESSEYNRRGRSVNAATYLPSGAATFDFEMDTGKTYRTASTFIAESNCTMNIYRTCAMSGTACVINLKVINASTGAAILNKNLNVDYPGDTYPVNLVAGNSYYIEVTLVGNGPKYVAFVVSGN